MHEIDCEDSEIIKEILRILDDSESLLLCTVLKTWGSSPRAPGSLMLIRKNASIMGSLSGGCVEDDIIRKYKADYFCGDNLYKLIYGGSDEPQVRIPCGSILEILVEKISRREDFEDIKNTLADNKHITRVVNIETGDNYLTRQNAGVTAFYYDEKVVKKTFGPVWQLLLIGANQVALYVSRLGKTLGYNITICEPREEYRDSWNAGDGELLTMMPDDAVNKYSTAAANSSVVLALSHDPKLDDMALMAALEQDIFYVGAIGSAKNNKARRDRLKCLGLSHDDIARLHGPVGMDIGSKMPSEIAVSIFAELICLRNNKC